jgi:plasmid maintenance system antidote protein VapI
MKLNTEKIRKELERIGETQVWLAEQLGVTRQRVNQILSAASLKNAERIGKVFGIEPKDLIR